MPVRRNGDPIVFWLEEEKQWVEGSVIKYIRGFGYEVQGQFQDETIHGIIYLYTGGL